MNLIIVDNHGLFLHSLKEVLKQQEVITEVYTFFPSDMEQLKNALRKI